MKEQIEIVESLIFKQTASDATALRAVLTELKMRCEVGEMADKLGLMLWYTKDEYATHEHGRMLTTYKVYETLPEAHAKLTELTKFKGKNQ